MLIHEFVSGNKPIMVLIHGVLTPWQVWMPQIEFYKNQYNVYAVSLNAHTEEIASEFISVCAEAEEIIRLLKEEGIQVIDVLCGISLGGKIADCGTMIFDATRQDVHSGGSGCGCSAVTLCGYLLDKVKKGELRRILFCGTGALLSPVSTQQGLPIPGVCHGVSIEGG